ncbi:AAA family ATPase [Mucilaginibacter sp. BJC16-A38]|uniref:AAA family ATPase n=1 Tax=Mucilaginibacter phenanthrenivorans TaxID=1234842 RepID=UPI0021571C97|nr:AAA family ATPase [Mucilaginibacter phenanthrenivorans]MCR8561610.1 AAA family ATPase [Mucilaginibacter phenanthrenivorans]
MPTYPPPAHFGTSSERPSYIEQLRAESRGLPLRQATKQRPERTRPTPEDVHRLFTIEKGNRWLELARREPEAKMLLGELWHQGELCMLFADTNIGKSILAVQIGESIARGQSLAPFACQAPPARVLYIDFELGQSLAPFACQAPPARVLYIDFELSKTQFGLRYSQGDEDHQFSDNFFRAQYNFLPDPPPNVDENELLIAGIEYKINQVKASVLIIDNITCLRGGTENSAVALALMKSLKALKNDHNLSILVLAHTPKRRNATQPISSDDLHGSKLLVNFADSAFAIGKSTLDNELCYLKQIKQRNTRQRYGHDNVCLCRIQKPGAFLHFAFEGHSPERLHLLTRTATDRLQLARKITALSAKGFSQRDIANQLGIGLATVNRLLRCADVQMRECANEEEGCADGEECADMQMRGCANQEEKCADGEECADMRMRECADGEVYANDLMTNNQNNPPANSLPREGREGLTDHAIPPGTQVEHVTPRENPNPTRIRKTSAIDELLTPQLLDHILKTTQANAPSPARHCEERSNLC